MQPLHALFLHQRTLPAPQSIHGTPFPFSSTNPPYNFAPSSLSLALPHYPTQALNASLSNTPFTLNASSSHTFHHPKHPLHHSPFKPTSQTKAPSIPQHSPTPTATTPYKRQCFSLKHSLHPKRLFFSHFPPPPIPLHPQILPSQLPSSSTNPPTTSPQHSFPLAHHSPSKPTSQTKAPGVPLAFLHTDATNPLHRVHPSLQPYPNTLTATYPIQAPNTSPSNTPFALQHLLLTPYTSSSPSLTHLPFPFIPTHHLPFTCTTPHHTIPSCPILPPFFTLSKQHLSLLIFKVYFKPTWREQGNDKTLKDPLFEPMANQPHWNKNQKYW
ncbi:hypothetical protein m07a_12100 [Bartonella schoenbuchensis m07a]|uniref:Uncharacterized protein n=1 Tax=Bartonella schoenbuchensis m07a TaxID=1094496 RepID=N6UK71_9HYPH|nr:hypothetical protein m07a_12100 [Bartonella schoenbuchensis m07a]